MINRSRNTDLLAGESAKCNDKEIMVEEWKEDGGGLRQAVLSSGKKYISL